MDSYVVYKDRLKGEYLNTFESVEAYGCVKMVKEEELEEAMTSLLDMFLEGQEMKKDVKDIVGDNLQTFCEDFFEKPRYVNNYVSEFPNIIYRFSWIIFFFSLFDLLCADYDNHTILEIGSDFSAALVGLMSGMILSSLCNVIFGRVFFGKKNIMAKLFWIQVSMLILIGAIVGSICRKLDFTMPTLVLLIMSAIYLLTYKISIWIKRYQKYGSIKKTEEEKARSFSGIVKSVINEQLDSEGFDDTFMKMLNERYERIHKKKGTTYADFNVKFKKEQKFMEKENLYMAFIYFVIGAVATFFVAKESSPLDSVIFIVVLAIVLFFIWKIFSKMTKHGVLLRKKLIERAEKENVTIMDIIKNELEN